MSGLSNLSCVRYSFCSSKGTEIIKSISSASTDSLCQIPNSSLINILTFGIMLRNRPLSQTPERLVVNLFKEKYCILSIQGLEFKIELEPVRTAEQKQKCSGTEPPNVFLLLARLGGWGLLAYKCWFGVSCNSKAFSDRQDARARQIPVWSNTVTFALLENSKLKPWIQAWHKEP